MPKMYIRDKKYVFCHFVNEHINTNLKHTLSYIWSYMQSFSIAIYDFVPVMPV